MESKLVLADDTCAPGAEQKVKYGHVAMWNADAGGFFCFCCRKTIKAHGGSFTNMMQHLRGSHPTELTESDQGKEEVKGVAGAKGLPMTPGVTGDNFFAAKSSGSGS